MTRTDLIAILAKHGIIVPTMNDAGFRERGPWVVTEETSFRITGKLSLAACEAALTAEGIPTRKESKPFAMLYVDQSV